MFLSELKRVLKDPFMQGAILGIGTYCVLLIVVQKTLPAPPDLALNIPKEAFQELLEGQPLCFDFAEPLGQLILSKMPVS